MKSPDIGLRREAAQALATLQPWGKKQEHATALTAALGDSDPGVRLEAARGFGRVVPPPEVVPSLVAMLEAEDAEHRCAAAAALRHGLTDVGAEHLPALLRAWKRPKLQPVLTELLEHQHTKAPDLAPQVFELIQSAGDEPERQRAVRVMRGLAPQREKEAVTLAAHLRLEEMTRQVIGDLRQPERRRDALSRLAKQPLDAALVVPALLQLLKEGTPEERLSAVRGLRHYPKALEESVPLLRRLRGDPSHAVRLQAALILSEREETRREAVEELGALARQGGADSIRKEAVTQLKKLAPAVAEAVTELARAALEASNSLASEALAELGPAAKAAVPALVQMKLREPDDWLGYQRAAVLRKIGPEAVPLVTALLGHPEAATRRNAAHVLGRLGATSETVLAALAGRLRDSDGQVQLAAARALGRLGAGARPAVKALVERLEGRPGAMDRTVLESLAAIGPAAAGSRPRLERLLSFDRPGPGADQRTAAAYRAQVARTLAALGPAAQGAAPALRERLKDASLEVRLAAADALWRVARDGAATEAMLALLALKEPSDCLKAAQWLWREQKHAAVLPRLIAILDAENKGRLPGREKSGYPELGLLAEMGPKAAPAVPSLRLALRQRRNPYPEKGLALALAAMGPSAKEAVPELIEKAQYFIKTGRGYFPGELAACAHALGKIGPAARPGVPTLIELLKTRNPDLPGLSIVPVAAAEALGNIGPDAKDAVPDLLRLVDWYGAFERRKGHQDIGERQLAQVSRAAREALKRIDPEAAKKANVR